jgi:hypothetical protein
MTIRFEDITSQVNGTQDTFTTLFPFLSGTLVIGYNGQLFPPGTNLKQEIAPNSFQMTFAPQADTNSLMIVYDDGQGGGASNGDTDIVASSLPFR